MGITVYDGNCERCALAKRRTASGSAFCSDHNPTLGTSRNVGPLDAIRMALPKLRFQDVKNAFNAAISNAGITPTMNNTRRPNPPPFTPYRSYPIPSFFPTYNDQAPSSSQSTNIFSTPNGKSKNSVEFQISTSSGELQKRDEADAVREFHRIVGFCSSCGIPFIDDSFPQSLRSLGNLSQNGPPDAVPCKVDAKDLVWLRPQHMFTKDGQLYCWAVFRDPKSTDIEQGALGNCWFLSALAVIAERPDILEQIVLTKVYNPTGVYQIRLCVDGEWQVVVVDDFFPCRKRSRSLAFAVGRRNQLWVPLIEKAFAKISGSYAKLISGRALEGLAVLTGAPCTHIDLEEATTSEAMDIIWASLLSTREACFVMGCSCGAGERPVVPDVYRSRGLEPKHTYSLLDVKEYRGSRLVRLRNPWGTFVWNGDWSDNWHGWTPASRSVLLPNGPEAGAFWMPFDQFLLHFNSVEVAKVRSFSGWKELRASFTLKPSWGKSEVTAFRIHVEESTEIAVTLHQKGGREIIDADLMVLLHKIDPSNAVSKLITSCIFHVRSPRKLAASVATKDVFLNGPQEYYLIPVSFSNINEGKNLDLVVALHSAKPLVSERITLPAIAVTDSLVQLMLKESKQKNFPDGVVSRFLYKDFSGHLLMYDNLQERNYVFCDCSESENVVSSRSTVWCADSIPPLHRQIVIMLTHCEATAAYSLRHKLVSRLSASKDLQDYAYLFPKTNPVSPYSDHVPSLNSAPADVIHQLRPILR